MASSLDLGTLQIKIGVDNTEANSKLQQTEKQVASSSESIKSSLKTIGTTALALGTAAVGAGVGIYKFTEKIASAGDEIDKQSQKLNVSAEQYQAMSFAAEHCGFSVGTFTTAARKLAQTEFDGNIYDAVNALIAIEDPAERAAMASELFGSKAGPEMAALLNGGADLNQYMQQLDSLGGLMSNESVANCAAFEDAVTDVKTAFQGAAAQLIKDYMPTITKTIQKITEFIGNGGLQGLLNKIKELTPIVAGLTAAMVAYKVAMSITAIINAVTTAINAVRIANEGATTAQALLNAVMNANPFVLIATLVAGVAAAIVTLWHTNDNFRNACLNAWNAIKNAFSTAGAIISKILGTIKNALSSIVHVGGNLITGLWNGISNKVGWIISKIRGFGSQVISAIKGIFGIHSPSTVTAEIGDYLVQGLAKGIDDNTNLALAAVNDLCGDIEGAFNPSLNAVASGYGYGNTSTGYIASSGNRAGASSGTRNITQNNYFTSREMSAYEQQVQIKRLQRDLVGGIA